MKRCALCKSEPLRNVELEDSISVGDRRFTALLPALECPTCGEGYFQMKELQGFEATVARTLVTLRDDSSQGFRFMRKSLGLPAAELARLLNVAPETVSRWENDKLPVERRALAILQSLVIEHGMQRPPTLERLRALANGPKPAGALRIEVDPRATPPRQLGLHEGEYEVPTPLHEPLPAETIAAFEGEAE